MTEDERRMLGLMRSFPTLADVDMEEGFDPIALDFWDWEDKGEGARHSAQFVLSVWSGKTTLYEVGAHWDVGIFDVVQALKVWDDEHRRAFLAWATEPWWP